MRPPTHDDPNAIPRNGTDVPWVDLEEPGRTPAARRRDEATASTAGDRRRRR